MKPEDIKALRAAYGMTQEEFARAIGVTKQTLYFWEKGTYTPSRYDLVVLYKLWAMLHDPEERRIAQEALLKAKNLPPTPPQKDTGLGSIVAGGLIGFGLGLLLSSLFGEKNNEDNT